jgi:hypothetical protein
MTSVIYYFIINLNNNILHKKPVLTYEKPTNIN